MKSCNAKGDVSWNDSQQRFLAQHSITALLRHCFDWLQYCSNIATLCCSKYRRDDWQRRVFAQHSVAMLEQYCCESSRVTIPLQNCSNIATLCCAEIRRCESFTLKVMLHGTISKDDI